MSWFEAFVVYAAVVSPLWLLGGFALCHHLNRRRNRRR